jgi:hypothetical protein
MDPKDLCMDQHTIIHEIIGCITAFATFYNLRLQEKLLSISPAREAAVVISKGIAVLPTNIDTDFASISINLVSFLGLDTSSIVNDRHLLCASA